MCIKDVLWGDIHFYESGKAYDVVQEFDNSVLISLAHIVNHSEQGYRFYYRKMYLGLIYEDYFISLEDYRYLKLGELGI